MNDLKDPPVVSHTWQLNSKLKVKTPFYLVGFIFILEEMQGGGGTTEFKQTEIGCGFNIKNKR